MKLCRAAETVKVQAKELVSDSYKVDAVNKNMLTFPLCPETVPQKHKMKWFKCWDHYNP